MARKKMSMEEWENSAEDKKQDMKLAKKNKMSFADWEKSSKDVKHDTQQSPVGLKKGGMTMNKMMGGNMGYAKGGAVASKMGDIPMQTAMAMQGPKKMGNLNAGTSASGYKAGGRLYAKGGKIGAAPCGKLY